MIPKLIHYVWVGSPLPDHQRRNIDTWRDNNPDFEVVQWDETNIDFSHPQTQRAYEERLWAKVADIARLMAVSRQGGFYFDVDFELYRSLQPLLGHACVLGFQDVAQSADWVSNGMLAAVPGHWFIEKALERVLALQRVPFGFDRPTRYGPKLITRLLIEEGLTRYDAAGVRLHDMYICPTPHFFPWPYGEPFQEAFITAATFGMHKWEKSWERSVPIWVRLGKHAVGRLRGARRSFAR